MGDVKRIKRAVQRIRRKEISSAGQYDYKLCKKDMDKKIKSLK